MNRLFDLSGKTFTRLKIVKKGKLPNTSQAVWECQCVCGKTSLVRGEYLRKGKIKSCGCLKLERMKARKLPIEELKRRKAEAARKKSIMPKRIKQKKEAQLRYQITDKAALAQFRRWIKKQKKPVHITEDQLLFLRKQKCHKCDGDIPRTGVCFMLINPRGAIEITNVVPTCGYCKLIKPKENFDPIEFSKKVLRRAWKKTPMASMAKQKARKAVGKYECAKCKELFSDKKMDLDHLDPVTPIDSPKQNLEIWALRLLCDDSNLQYMCKPCHRGKTAEENKLRILKKKEGKEK